MTTADVQAIVDAPSTCSELKKVATDWLNHQATDEQLLAEIKEDITTIDNLIAFTDSDKGREIFGEEKAKQMNEHARAAKAKGEEYCTCPACQAAKKILLQAA